MAITYKEERISADEYIDFLKRTDLGSQYPKERFYERIGKLVNNVSISLIARNEENKIIGALFGLTDYCYWLYVTDLGVMSSYLVRQASGKKRLLGIFIPRLHVTENLFRYRFRQYQTNSLLVFCLGTRKGLILAHTMIKAEVLN